ncbi:hypothetical protein [Flavobacterium luminosum]|uniref:Roadblock/LC7 domain-containing protein n=1 Tax=Flavobacterium luminosum TaxID=2949086 RepID=A0ABT0TQ04_9FLAO|nr:hypothetical protein [Flavobacterium sp. HXWNR70]MCL9809576.1 hypothetical protein [Flavobacterium sp. HXWNR70]
MSDFLTTFTTDLKDNLAGFIGVSVTEIKTGMSFASLSVDPNFDPELASAYNLEVVKAKFNALKALGLDQKIDDILITLSNQIHIIDLSDNGEYFVYLAVDSSKVNLGMARATLKKYSKDIAGKL